MELKIKNSIIVAFSALYDHEISAEAVSLQPTRKDFEGTYTFVTFPFSKVSKKSPEETGNAIGTWVTENSSVVEGFNVVKGFLNFVLNFNKVSIIVFPTKKILSLFTPSAIKFLLANFVVVKKKMLEKHNVNIDFVKIV